MTLDLAHLKLADARVEGLTLRRVTTEEDLRAWVSVAAEGFHFNQETAQKLTALARGPVLDPNSRAHLYLGLLHGEPVGTALNIHGEEIAGVWCVSILERARGRGIGAAMTTGPLLAAREAGYASAMLGATEQGFPVYSRLGWEVQFSAPIHLGGPA
ncbi:GNAT family N-acetyltransferase [Deinococcus malanensis]|uniref:GNAT family N-acetyltransferase n=1 Tax=Deinococcus malanensis TaxID=1706855 RepID=UPI003640E3F8